ncbi:MAG: protein-tyrosine phosphatase [Marinoscillum sp.]|jgi:protein-tyrosine phosphatase
MIKVLFVCLGNICRSPLAEAIFNDKVAKKGFSDKVSSDSCGTANYHTGKLPDHRSIQIAEKNNIPMDHSARKFQIKDAKEFDYILAMDQSNYRNILHEISYKPEGLFLMRSFDLQGKDLDVPDPYYGGLDGFKDVYQILDRSIEELITYLLDNHDLS